MNSATWIGLSGSALLFSTAVTTLVAKVKRYPVRVRSLIFIAAFGAALFPLTPLPLAGYIRGGIGDLSVTTWLLLSAAVLSKLRNQPFLRAKSVTGLSILLLGSGLLLYTSALGVTYWDAYALGYGTKSLLVAFLLLSLGAWILGYHLAAICLTVSVLAYTLQILESRNLWDYWIDPLLAVYALYKVSFRVKDAKRKRAVLKA
jgi:hypothetical protein